MNLFTFDIETVPDTKTGRKLYALPVTMSEQEVANIMQEKRKEKTGNDFLPLHLHRVVAISVVLKAQNSFNIWSLGDCNSSEQEILQRFFTGIDKYTPTLISYNGSGFDLPVLHYRALLHSVKAARYWEQGVNDQTFKWNNYINRYHDRHSDVMDILSCYQPRATAPLDEVASMLGFPGKMGMHGNKVWENFLAGNIEAIRNYCETDVLNTYLIFLRFLLTQGKITQTEEKIYHQEIRDFLLKSGKEHLINFNDHWAQNF